MMIAVFVRLAHVLGLLAEVVREGNALHRRMNRVHPGLLGSE